MSKQKNQKAGYGKILDAWIPPEDAGDPVGCVATSFTFSPELFEEDCLGRFLQLETNETEDGPAYLVEREEKLSQLVCAAALVDQHHAHGMCSLRWDLLPARLSPGILHAKVSLLLWSRSARLIVASANLTKDGYRRNHEVFGALDYFEGSESPLSVLDDIIGFLKEAVRFAAPSGDTSSAAIDRWNEFLGRVSKATRGWGLTEFPRSLGKPRVHAVLSGPGRPGVFDRLREVWPGSTPPRDGFVLSPFFDPPEAENRPAKELWGLLKQRGEAFVQFDVTAEEVTGESAVILHTPKSLLEAQPATRNQAETKFTWLKPGPDDQPEEGRLIHAKSLWLQDGDLMFYMIGSSNFTSAGYGLGRTRNFEANLAYAVDEGQNPAAGRTWLKACLAVDEFPEGLELRYQPRQDTTEDEAGGDIVLLPSGFSQANFGCDDQQQAFVEFNFTGTPPSGWALFAEDDREPFTSEANWKMQGSPPQFRVSWLRERAPSVFRATWADSGGSAWWPVNVLCSAALPPPAELRNLPLEVLIDILTSAKPLHRALQSWLRRQKDGQSRNDVPVSDPHKRVDTSAFLLQRTRRVSDALTALRQRLEERPVVSEQGLAWRLRGPVGVMALAQALGKEARSEHERCFLLTELCLEMGRVKPETAPGSLSAARVQAALREVAHEIRDTISPDALASLPALAAYTKAAFEDITL